jgi:hypothetical protein
VTHYYILLSQIRDSLNLEDKVPVFIAPRNRVAQLYPQALDYAMKMYEEVEVKLHHP